MLVNSLTLNPHLFILCALGIASFPDSTPQLFYRTVYKSVIKSWGVESGNEATLGMQVYVIQTVHQQHVIQKASKHVSIIPHSPAGPLDNSARALGLYLDQFTYM